MSLAGQSVQHEPWYAFQRILRPFRSKRDNSAPYSPNDKPELLLFSSQYAWSTHLQKKTHAILMPSASVVCGKCGSCCLSCQLATIWPRVQLKNWIHHSQGSRLLAVRARCRSVTSLLSSHKQFKRTQLNCCSGVSETFNPKSQRLCMRRGWHYAARLQNVHKVWQWVSIRGQAQEKNRGKKDKTT